MTRGLFAVPEESAGSDMNREEDSDELYLSETLVCSCQFSP